MRHSGTEIRHSAPTADVYPILAHTEGEFNAAAAEWLPVFRPSNSPRRVRLHHPILLYDEKVMDEFVAKLCMEKEEVSRL